MSDIIKWGLLVAGFLIIVALIVALPISDGIDFDALNEGITIIVDTLGDYLKTARGFLNNLVLPNIGVTILSATIAWLFLKLPLRYSIRLTIKVYHYIFK